MHCYNCGVYCELSDNYCRKCGAPVRSGSMISIVPVSNHPVSWRDVKTNVVRGAVTFTAAVALEVISQLLLKRTRFLQAPSRGLLGSSSRDLSIPDRLREALSRESSGDEYTVIEGFAFKETRVRR